MFRTLLFLIPFIFSAVAWSKDDVSITTDSKIYVGKAVTSTNQEITFDVSSSGSYDSPHEIYIPIDDGTNNDYTILSKTNLPTLAVAGGFFQVSLTLAFDNTSYIYAAVEPTDGIGTDAASWKIFQSYDTTGSDTNDTTYNTGSVTSVFTVNGMCASATSFCVDGTTGFRHDRKIYIFASTTDYANGATIKPDDHDDGTFIKVHVSDLYPKINKPSTSSAYKGDSQIKITYSGNYSDETDGVLEGVIACVSAADATCTTITDDSPYQSETSNCSLNGETYPASTAATIEVDGLTNNSQYHIGIAFLNKFKFASALEAPAISCETPLEIEVLLEETECYLLTAGFGSDHKVIQYFRYIRDSYLAKITVGKWFIKSYYASAPGFTKFILNTPIVAAVVRGFAWSLYFLMNNFLIVLVGLTALIVFVKSISKNLFRFRSIK